MMPDALSHLPLDVLTLSIGGEIFAIEATAVREILDLGAVTEVPGARPFVGGVVNVRGAIVPLADLRRRFDMPLAPPTVDSRIVVLELVLDGQALLVGILADRVHEVTQLTPATLEKPPRIGLRWPSEFIRGVGMRGDQLLVLPDLTRILH